MTFLEMQARVIQKLAETATPNYWTLDEIKANINRGYREFIKQTELKTTTVALVPADTNDGWIIPADMLIPKAVYAVMQGELSTYNKRIDQTTADYLDGIDDWLNLFGNDPLKWFIDSGLIKTYPLYADGNGEGGLGNLKIRYVVCPTALDENTDVPEIPTEYQDSLVSWALFECFSRDGDGQDLAKSNMYAGLFKKMVDELVRSLGQWNLNVSGDFDDTFRGLIDRTIQVISKFGNPLAIAQETVKTALNNGYKKFARESGFCITTSSLVKTGDYWYEIPTDLMIVKGVYCDGLELDQTNHAHLDAMVNGTGGRIGVIGEGGKLGANWRTAVGSPMLWLWDEALLRVYPAVSLESTSVITMSYIPAPAPLALLDDVPIIIPPGYRDALVSWAIAECLRDNPKADRQVAAELERFKSLLADCQTQFMPPLVKLPQTPFLV